MWVQISYFIYKHNVQYVKFTFRQNILSCWFNSVDAPSGRRWLKFDPLWFIQTMLNPDWCTEIRHCFPTEPQHELKEILIVSHGKETKLEVSGVSLAYSLTLIEKKINVFTVFYILTEHKRWSPETQTNKNNIQISSSTKLHQRLWAHSTFIAQVV